jgi:AmmeMemoRadiSam system protein A
MRRHHPAVGADAEPTGPAALALAREAVERYVRTGLVAEAPPGLPSELREPRAVFVTLRIRGVLRGCIGTLAPGQADAAGEIVSCAIAAAARDPRFPAVRPDELAELEYEVDLVGTLELVGDVEDLDPATYGVVVEGFAGRRGVLLPAIDGVTDAIHQVRIARGKAGLSPAASVSLSRFRVRRFRETAAPETG